MNYPNFDKESKSLLRKYLTKEVFEILKSKKTINDVSLSKIIKSGLENPDSNIGVYAGDIDSYKVFSDLFDPIINDYHGFGKNDVHKTNLQIEDLDISNPDPTGQYILSTRIRVGRNLDGIPLGSIISKKERKQLSITIKKALLGLSGDLKGNYHALNDLSPTIKTELINDHFLFKQGDRFLAAAGLNRDWPDGRGIFFNERKNFLVWVNEEDHMRIISMQKGADIKEVFIRLIDALQQIEKQLVFSYSKRLGYISSCPTNLGTAMRASVHISLPHLSRHMDKLKSITNKFHLQIRGVHGEHSETENSIFDISNKRRLGITEIQSILDLSQGVESLIKAEKSYNEV